MTAQNRTIVTLVPYPFLPAKVGGQKGIALFNKYFARRVKLVCVTVKSNNPANAEGYELQNIISDSPARYGNLLYFFTLKRLLKKYNATHLLIEHPYYGWLGTWLKAATGVKLIVHSHNIESLRFRTLGKWWWKILWNYERFTHRNADLNLFIHDDDRNFAVKAFRLDASKCITVTYGIEWEKPPTDEEHAEAGLILRRTHSIGENESILLFNGAFNYRPNLDALQRVINTINPLLQQKTNFRYRILICGRDIPEEYLTGEFPNVIITGFVDDIGLYFKGADVFLNPVVEGGGIKTKLVEALGYNLNSVSTQNGAIGVNPDLCNSKLLISADTDWQQFSANIITATKILADTPHEYFRHFYWGHSIEKLVNKLDSQEHNEKI